MSVDCQSASETNRPSKQATHLANRGEAYESDRCYTGTCNIETETASSTSSAGRANELSPELCELGLQLSEVIARRLVFLR